MGYEGGVRYHQSGVLPGIFPSSITTSTVRKTWATRGCARPNSRTSLTFFWRKTSSWRSTLWPTSRTRDASAKSRGARGAAPSVTPRFMQLYFSRMLRSEYSVCCQIVGRGWPTPDPALPFVVSWHGGWPAYISCVAVTESFRGQALAITSCVRPHPLYYTSPSCYPFTRPRSGRTDGWQVRRYAGVITCKAISAIRTCLFRRVCRISGVPFLVLLHDEAGYGVYARIYAAVRSVRPQAEDIPAMLIVINAKQGLAPSQRPIPALTGVTCRRRLLTFEQHIMSKPKSWPDGSPCLSALSCR